MSNSIILPQNLLMIDAENECIDYRKAAVISDSHLITLTLAGDETAFAVIFDRYKKHAAIIASRYFRRAEQIEEIVQITFTKAFFELKNFRGENDFSFPGWLGRIATNACLDALKKRSYKAEDLIGSISESEAESLLNIAGATKFDAEKNLIGRDLAEKLLVNLPIADRALLQMIYAEEMSVKEIAQITGWSPSNIKIRAFRARRALRKILRKLL